MPDFQQALEQALFDRLDAQVTLAPVYQHVPQDTPPPVVIIADIAEEDIGTKDSILLRFEIDIVCIVRGAARKPLNAMQSEVRDALHDWTPAPAGGVLFGDIQQRSKDGQLMPDGEHYYGTQRFTCIVQPG